MTGAQFVSIMQARLGQRSDIAAATINLETELARTVVMEKTTFFPWFLQKELTAAQATVANQEYTPLPVDFLGFDEDDEWSGLCVNDLSGAVDPWKNVQLDDFKIIQQKYQRRYASDSDDNLINDLTVIVSRPRWGGLINTNMYLRPIPDQIYPLRWRYYATDAVTPIDGTTNLWLTHAPDWLLGETGIVLAGQYVKDTECMQIFEGMRDRGRKRCYNQTIARKENGKLRSAGDE